MSSLLLSIEDCVLLEKALLIYRETVPRKDPECQKPHIGQLLSSVRAKRKELERGGI